MIILAQARESLTNACFSSPTTPQPRIRRIGLRQLWSMPPRHAVDDKYVLAKHACCAVLFQQLTKDLVLAMARDEAKGLRTCVGGIYRHTGNLIEGDSMDLWA